MSQPLDNKIKSRIFLISTLGVLIFLVLWLIVYKCIVTYIVLDGWPAFLYALCGSAAGTSLYVYIAITYPRPLGLVRDNEKPRNRDGVYTCSKCGVTTSIDKVFVQTKNKKFYCPPCFEKYRVSKFFLNIMVLGVVGITLINIDPAYPVGWIILNAVLMEIMWLLVIVPHELGHLVMSGLLGMRIFSVSIGIGKTIFKREFLGTDLELKLIPLAGVTASLSGSFEWLRLKKILVALAGPLTNIIFAVFIFTCTPEEFDVWGVFMEISPLAALFWGNILVAGTNIFPKKVRISSSRINSDGMNLIKISFMKKKELNQYIEIYYSFEGLYWRKQKNYSKAIKLFETGLEYFPDSVVCKHNIGVVLMDMGKFEKAWSIFHELVSAVQADSSYVHMIKNNFAYATVVAGCTEYLDRADEFSRYIYENFSWVVYAKGTRGAVLIEVGRPEEGLALLDEAIKEETSDALIARYICHKGVGLSRQGHRDQALECLKAARDKSPHCKIIDFLEHKLAMRH